MSKLLEQINNTKTTQRLGDLVLINQSTINGNFSYKEIEYIDTASVTKNHFEKPQILNTVEAPSRAKRLLKDGDTILSTVRPNLRHYGFIKNPKPNTVASTGFVVLTPKSIDPFYLYSYLTQDSITDTLSSIAEATTTTFPAFRPEVLSEMEIEIPDLSTQKKIAEILSAYDSKIENNNKIIKNLEATAQAIFDEWFINFRFPGYEKVKIIEGEMGEIPTGWEVKSVLDVIERIPVGKKFENKTASPIGKVPILDQGASGFIGYHNEEPGVEASIENPVVVFTNHTCYYRLLTEPFSCIQNVLPYIGKNGYKTLFVYFLTKEKIKMSEYKGHWPEFEQQVFVIPPVELANSFVSKIKSFVSEMVVLEKENVKLKESRDQLLAKLI
jgi:type I restriction enzyme S subunit